MILIREENTLNLKIKYSVGFIGLSLFIFFVATYLSESKIKRLIEFEKNLVSTTYKSTVNEYTTHANILFENVIEQKDVLKIFSGAMRTPE